MKNILYKLKKHLRKCYGTDQLNTFFLTLSVILFVINYFTRNYLASFFIQLILLLTIFRSLSTNIWTRQKENKIFLSKTKKIRNFYLITKKQFNDKDHKYFACPSCSRITRVPKGKGKIEIKCPHCKQIFDRKS